MILSGRNWLMEINIDRTRLKERSIVNLINHFEENEQELGLEDAQLYYEFPIFKNLDNAAAIAKLLLVSPNHGAMVIVESDITQHNDLQHEMDKIDLKSDDIFSLLYSRLLRNRELRRTRKELAFPINIFVFAYLLSESPKMEMETDVFANFGEIDRYFGRIRTNELLPETYSELISTIEGVRGIVSPKTREISDLEPDSKGALANKIETEISKFDQQQKHGAMAVLDGFQRIRGLAGSGKTVVLAMKAALTHLRDQESTIVYTFYTKSLYQHIQRLITRFYRQFDDKDPDWSKIKIMHGWGGRSVEGVYYNACVAHDAPPVTYREARVSRDPFDYACTKLLESTEIMPIYDYIFVDEGQDFPASFIKLCVALAKQNKVVFAYDDLQTIFQPTAPAIKDIIGEDDFGNPLLELNEDVVLAKCYRNPREILVCAHASGFGIYGQQIVQMLENRDQWGDIGYIVHKGDFTEGSPTEIERPAENSLTTISENQDRNEIVKAFSYASFAEEIEATIRSIKDDLAEGLRPEDILVITVDDRNAKNYLSVISRELASLGINSNNIHEDSYGIRDFHKDEYVTLSTVHKAKGNEAFMVYVVGVDALFKSFVGPRERNMLFTAMTRAKGWVRVSGIGQGAKECKSEITKALKEFPYLRFDSPSQEQIKIIRRDLAKKDSQKQAAERKLDEILDFFTPEEVEKFVRQRNIKKRK